MSSKIGSALLALLLTCTLPVTALAADITEGKQYQTIGKPLADTPPVVEFFSFYCPHCYDFEQVLHVSSAIKKSLPAGTEYAKYHVNFMGPLAPDLTHAWAIAITMGVGNKVIGPLFDGIQKTKTINTAGDIRDVFIKAAGITQQEYDSAWDSFVVKSLVLRQQQAAAAFQLNAVPSVYVTGKYVVNIEGMDNTSAQAFTNSYVQTVNYLLSKK